MLELRHITKCYRTTSLVQVALDDVSVAFRDNEFVAVLGHSGSGKTTMLNVVGGLDHFDDGDLVIDGISTRDYKDRDWDAYRNNRIGFVFQSYNLIPHQSVLANVELALTLSGVSRAERRKRALAALTEVGLADHVGKKPSQLSGGQMQRVAIARALVNDPEILLADEPTGALDSGTSVQVMDLLRDVAKDRLVIMVTHNPQLAHDYATRIVELADGRIVADSDPFIPGTEEMREAAPARRTSMSPLTALSLSATNLLTKKGRTIMTSFAGSIGIIGIASILALANGVNLYIEKTQEDALTSYPLTISRTEFDMSEMMIMGTGSNGPGKKQAADGQVLMTESFSKMMSSTSTNDLASFKTYLDNDGGKIKSHVAAIEYSYDITPQIYLADTSKGVVRVNPDQAFSTISSAYGSGAFSGMVETEGFHQMPENVDLYKKDYEVVAGDWPTKDDELLLVLDHSGTVPDLFEYALGLRDHAELDSMMNNYYSGNLAANSKDSQSGAQSGANRSYDYADIVGTTLKLVRATERYQYDETYKVWTDKSSDTTYMTDKVNNGQDLKIVGIVKAVDGDTRTLRQGVAYLPSLTRRIMDEAAASDIVKAQLARPDIDVFSGKTFDEIAKDKKESSSFDMSSLFSIDESKIRAAFNIDPSKLQMDLSGMDFSSMDASAFDLSALALPPMDPSAFDMSGLDANALAGALDPSQFDLSNLKLSDLATKYPQLSQIDFQKIISTTLGPGVLKEGAGQFLAERLTAFMDGYRQYYAEHADTNGDGVPDADPLALAIAYFQTPEVKASLNELLSSDKVIDSARLMDNLTKALGDDPALVSLVDSLGKDLTEAIGQKIGEQLSQVIATSISTAMSTYIEGAMTQTMSALMTQIQQAITEQMTAVMGRLSESMATAFSFDQEAFADAFTMNMDQDDLASLMSTMMGSQPVSYETNLRNLGWAQVSNPSQVAIYPTTFVDKDAVKAIITDYNTAKKAAGQDKQVITYTDMIGLLMSSVTRIIDIISWMLIAFVSISLVVSSIMIAIITFISVLERKKEIGILRSIGASKRDISHVFNAETIIEGFLAGIIGVGITLGLSAIANIVVSKLLHVDDIAQLPSAAALILIVVSIGLTFIAGVIPARKAAREDPVEALRSE